MLAEFSSIRSDSLEVVNLFLDSFGVLLGKFFVAAILSFCLAYEIRKLRVSGESKTQ